MRDPSAENWRRLSQRMIWVDLAQTLVSLMPLGLAIWPFGLAGASGQLWPFIIIAVIGIGGAASDAWRWAFTRYRITATHVELSTGVLIRSRRSVRRDRIRSVDVTATLRHRLGGLRLVKVGAGQQTATGESALELDAVHVADAAHLHALLSRDPAEHAPQTSEPVREPAEVLWRFKPSWVLHSMFSIWVFAAALGLLWGVENTLEVIDVDPTGWYVDLIDFDSRHWLVSTLFSLAVVAVVGVAVTAVTFLVENWGFELARVPGQDGTGLRTRRGLFTTREINRDEQRIRGLQLSEPLLLRGLGTAGLEVITTGLAQAALSSPAAIIPRGPLDEVRAVAETALPTDGTIRPAFDGGLQPHPRAALRRRLVRAAALATVGTIAVVALVVAGQSSGWLVVVGLLWAAAGSAALISWRALGHRLDGPQLVVRSGLWTRRTTVLDRAAVGTVAVRESVFQRRLGLRSVHLMTAAGQGVYVCADMAGDDAIGFAAEASCGLLDGFIVDR